MSGPRASAGPVGGVSRGWQRRTDDERPTPPPPPKAGLGGAGNYDDE